MLFCDVVHDVARSRLRRLSTEALPELQGLARELAEEGRRRLDADGIDASQQELALWLDLRYEGQASEIAVPVEAPSLDAATLGAAVARFHALHETAYAHASPGDVPELVTLRVTATGRLPMPAEPPPLAAGATPPPKGRRRAHVDGAWSEIPVYARDTLAPGARITGPVVVEEPYAVILVPAGWTLGGTPHGDLVAWGDATPGEQR